MRICILTFLKTGKFGDRFPKDICELISIYGKPYEIFSNGKPFLNDEEINNFLEFEKINKNHSEIFPLMAGYGDIQFHFHNDRANLLVCNYSYNRLPNSNHYSSDHFSLLNASLIKGEMRLAKFLEKMDELEVEISEINLSKNKLLNARFISVTMDSEVEINFCHESGFKDFRLCQFLKSMDS